MQIPRHLAIIMDGNGRWAQRKGLPRVSGHRRGVEVVREIVRECQQLGVAHLSLFAFSSENWSRPESEVQALMGLLTTFVMAELSSLRDNGIRLAVIGDRARLPLPVNEVLDRAIADTAKGEGMELILALSYGARNEQVRMVRDLASRVARGELLLSDIDESVISSSLDTCGIPDPDLLIRTSGEMRISNFLLWQLAYTELYFTDILWPDFNCTHLHDAFEEFGRRERRFGKTTEQLCGDVHVKESDH